MGVIDGGGLPDHDLIWEVTNYICHFGARYHHAREGMAFGYIVQRNPALSGTIDRLVQEHAEIAARGEELVALLAGAVAGDAAARAGIHNLMAVFLTAYRNHIIAEEQDILPYASKNLSAMEWKSVAGAAPPGPDAFKRYSVSRHSPDFGSEADARYRTLCEKIHAGHSARTMAHLGRHSEGRQEDVVRNRSKASGFVAAPRSRTMKPGDAPSGRLLVRNTVGLLGLVLAYLQYYYLDVQLQILKLPSILPILHQ